MVLPKLNTKCILDARTAWNSLHGVVCLYKPSGFSLSNVRKVLLTKLCDDLCAMKQRDPLVHVKIVGDTRTSLTVETTSSYADNPLMLGPSYIPSDIKTRYISFMGKLISGVCVIGLGKGTLIAEKIHQDNPLRTYHIVGKLGERTKDMTSTGKLVYRCHYGHINRSGIDQFLTVIQSSHQKQMFSSLGVDMRSQSAYDMAVKGPLRPLGHKAPIIYAIKCVDFNPPFFTIEIQCVNEYESYLLSLIDSIGEQIRCAAHTTSIKCIRYSHFSLEHALLKKHWNLENIFDNMAKVNETLKQVEITSNLLQPAQTPTDAKCKLDDDDQEEVQLKEGKADDAEEFELEDDEVAINKSVIAEEDNNYDYLSEDERDDEDPHLSSHFDNYDIEDDKAESLCNRKVFGKK